MRSRDDGSSGATKNISSARCAFLSLSPSSHRHASLSLSSSFSPLYSDEQQQHIGLRDTKMRAEQENRADGESFVSRLGSGVVFAVAIGIMVAGAVLYESTQPETWPDQRRMYPWDAPWRRSVAFDAADESVEVRLPPRKSALAACYGLALSVDRTIAAPKYLAEKTESSVYAWADSLDDTEASQSDEASKRRRRPRVLTAGQLRDGARFIYDAYVDRMIDRGARPDHVHFSDTELRKIRDGDPPGVACVRVRRTVACHHHHHHHHHHRR
jgi:hypothetical protein